MFSGTKTHCPEYFKPVFGDGYSLGSCKSKSKKITTYGLDPTALKNFDGMYFCVKRDRDMNHHELVKLRSIKGDSECASGTMCGAPKDKDRRFCLKAGQKCPLNALLSLPRSQTLDSKLTSEKAAMNSNWAGYKIFDNPDNTLMVDLRVRLSRPCGNAQQDYNARKYPISELYGDPKTCRYSSSDGNKEHPLYFESGFKVEEYDVYSQNGLLGKIKSKIPSWIYSDSDLGKNSYSMYFKPFATLKA